jgi:hypothetical protein
LKLLKFCFGGGQLLAVQPVELCGNRRARRHNVVHDIMTLMMKRLWEKWPKKERPEEKMKVYRRGQVTRGGQSPQMLWAGWHVPGFGDSHPWH